MFKICAKFWDLSLMLYNNGNDQFRALVHSVSILWCICLTIRCCLNSLKLSSAYPIHWNCYLRYCTWCKKSKTKNKSHNKQKQKAYKNKLTTVLNELSVIWWEGKNICVRNQYILDWSPMQSFYNMQKFYNIIIYSFQASLYD